LKTTRIIRFTLFFSVLFILCGKAIAIDLSEQNCSYWYDPLAEVAVQNIVVSSPGQFEVYLQLYAQHRLTDSLTFYSQRSYTAIEHYKLVPQFDTLRSSDQLFIVHFSVPDTTDNVLLLEYRNGKSYFFPIQLKFTNVKYPDFYIQGSQGSNGIIEKYLARGSYRVSSAAASDSVYVYRYKDVFSAADPPMSEATSANPRLSIDTLSLVPYDQFELTAGHFYLVQKDTSGFDGRTYYVGDAYFPKLTKLEELLGPIRYIARRSELQKIEDASDRKKAFDSFWLGLYPIKRNASDAIASYYQKVAQANEMLTSYKPGWKTDRGMVFIVFGIPSEVKRYDWREVWNYPGGLSFEFRIISNLFANQQYYLMRSQALAEPWYEAVKTLRNNR
jgi:GWxTD domain-containing protein